MVLHPTQASPQVAETAFAFLIALGFTLDERWISGGESFRDGWRLGYCNPRVRVVVQYLDAQFEVHFTRAETTAGYLAIDRSLFDRRSGYHGDMFSPEELQTAVRRIAEDVRTHYGPILAGDDAEWGRIARLVTTERPARGIP